MAGSQMQPDALVPALLPFVSARPSGAKKATRDKDVEAFRDWTKRVAAADEAAFTEFYEQYHLRIYRYLLVVSRGDEQATREVMQTVVLKAARSFKVFDSECELWAWLSRLARNAFIDLVRRRRRDSRFVGLEDLDRLDAQTSAVIETSGMAMAQAMAELGEEEQELIRAAYIDKRPLQELANESGQTYKAVESRLGRLRQRLKISVLRFLKHEQNP